MPLFLLWFGFGLESKIAMVALLSFFPILKATILGIRSIDGEQAAPPVHESTRRRICRGS